MPTDGDGAEAIRPRMASMPALAASAVIAGQYEVRGVLGEGGTGIVYDAVRLEDGLPVAVKVMHSRLAGDDQIRGRFRREAVILRRLEGPHICPILDFGEVPGEHGRTLLYLALPKLEGRSLEQVLRAEGPLDVPRIIDIMLEICAALRSAHAQGVVHRDLKPANVVVQPDGKVVVVDFGMAKIVTGAGTGTTNLTVHNMLFGTPEYMSPEQARGEELDARCDVYAAGVILYEMLTGEPPFTGPTPLNVLTAHLTSDLEPPSKRAPEGRVSKALESVVMYALERDRDRRYPSVSALAAALMHARTTPDEVDALGPEAFVTKPSGTDAFAATMPSVKVPPSSRPPSSRSGPSSRRRSTPSSRPVTNTQAFAKTVPAEERITRTWVALWVLAALASIALGIYLALR
ncbi:serine/threonine protein kinase [Labilithrix luteola]|uniref:non-specific serine/threonine protein kinase n=1 Tax=Labilithrix luteola TaxID=1391654 RepID=A0A0K1PRJ6_9BACT|nr:serine/threonine-protein kinase [Labilithrix luteola]AKU96153.1 serine/threonine protein kinase [Labilithrix luteola]